MKDEHAALQPACPNKE